MKQSSLHNINNGGIKCYFYNNFQIKIIAECEMLSYKIAKELSITTLTPALTPITKAMKCSKSTHQHLRALLHGGGVYEIYTNYFSVMSKFNNVHRNGKY